MAGWVGEHGLEALAGHSLAFAAALRLAARGAQPKNELVAGALELGDVDKPAGLGRGKALAAAGTGGLGVRRKAPLKPRDLVAQGAPSGGLVATFEWRGRDIVAPFQPRNRCLAGRSERGCRLEHLKIRCLGVAARVEHTGQIAGVNPRVARGIGRCGREFLDRRRRGACGNECALALPRGDQSLRLKAPVDGAGRVRVHSHPGGELAHARQAVPGGQPAADDQRSEPPGEVDAHRQVIPAIQLHLP